MEITRPDYYKEFSCIAGACPDTCCAGWQIVIDDKSLKKYKRVKGTFRNRLHNDIDWKEKVFRQYEKRCAFLNEDSLCDIYSEVGKRMLCDTCRKYPRHIEEFEGLREYSLSLSCPEAARILLGRREKVTFQTAEVPSPEETYDDFDYMLFTALEDTRECNNIINLVREIRTSCTNNFCTSCLGNIRHNLWNRVSHCKYNCIFIHSLDHIGCNDVRSRNSDKYILSLIHI